MISKVIDKYVHQCIGNLKIYKSPSYLFQILCVIENLHASSTFRLVLSVDRVRFPLGWYCGFISYYSIIIETDKHKEKQKQHLHITWVRSGGAEDKKNSKKSIDMDPIGWVGGGKARRRTHRQALRKAKTAPLHG